MKCDASPSISLPPASPFAGEVNARSGETVKIGVVIQRKNRFHDSRSLCLEQGCGLQLLFTAINSETQCNIKVKTETCTSSLKSR